MKSPRISPIFLSLASSWALFCVTTLALAAFAPGAAQAQTPKELYRQANQAYEQGQFQAAADGYREILKSAPGDPVIEYNLGNAYARLGDIGRAVLHYERALRSNPKHADARRNLLQLAPPSNAPPAPPLLWPFQWTKRLFNSAQWGWISLGIFWIACGAAALWAWRGRSNSSANGGGGASGAAAKWTAVSAAVVWVFAFGFFASCVSDDSRRPAIVIAAKVIARSGPGEHYLEAMELPAGAKVYASGESQKGWLRVQTTDGKSAYAQVRDLEWIVL